jgi:hypothetical protein
MKLPGGMMLFVTEFLSIFARFPKLGGLFGLIVATLFGILGVSSWQAYLNMPDTPKRISLAQAPSMLETEDEIWVEIDRVFWDCGNIVHTKSDTHYRTEIVFTDSARSILGLALFSKTKPLSCEDIQSQTASGTLRLMSDGVLKRMPERGFDLGGYHSFTSVVSLCTFCGRGNSLYLAIISVVMVPLGFIMYPLSIRLRRAYQKKGLL